jgi:hypothetical protein
MNTSCCSMPVYALDGKTQKRGTYCNWESVVRHAKDWCDDGQIDSDEFNRIVSAVCEKIGLTSFNTEAPHYTELTHFGGRMNDIQYHSACTYERGELLAVKISDKGEVYEINIDSNDGAYPIYNHIKCTSQSYKTSFTANRKGRQHNTIVRVFHSTDDTSQINIHASQLLKKELRGEIVIVQQSKETSFLPRIRYIDYNKQDFLQHFDRKKKTVEAMCTEEYATVKDQMVEELSVYEKLASAEAEAPGRKRARKLPPADGRQLARLQKHQRAERVAHDSLFGAQSEVVEVAS